jgi:UDP-N-acetylglucosamine 2-epimerase (non-hydrolysing)
MTLRASTERPETVTVGSNVLVGIDPSRLRPVLDDLFEGRWKKSSIPEKWDGRTGNRIAEILERLLTTGR